MRDRGLQRVLMAEQGHCAVRVARCQHVQLIVHARLDFQQEFASGYARSPSERVKRTPLLFRLKTRERAAGPLAEVDLCQPGALFDSQPALLCQRRSRFQRTLQRAAVDRVNPVVPKSTGNCRGLCFTVIAEPNTGHPAGERISDPVCVSVPEQENRGHQLKTIV
ncbi:MAG TPA: hypothetical protein VES20_23080 [Bryobacteraceae bacterium]|nr:hypothetical protein [Bryobacteraceae bacterium]